MLSLLLLLETSMKAQKGFTLIELMIVVAIIGILAAIALPAYQNYIAKARMSEVVLAASSCRTTITEKYQTANAAPGAGNWGCESSDPTSQYVASIATNADGVIKVGIRNINGDTTSKFIFVQPLITADTPLTVAKAAGEGQAAGSNLGSTVYGWRCGASDDLVLKYLPGSCNYKFANAPF